MSNCLGFIFFLLFYLDLLNFKVCNVVVNILLYLYVFINRDFKYCINFGGGGVVG